RHICAAFIFVLSSAPFASASVLLFGDRTSQRNQLAADLTSLGESVTNVTALPLDLTGYQVIWHVSAFTGLTQPERDELAAFVESGHGLHLTGERPCCETMNASLEALLNTIVSGGNITVGGQGDPPSAFSFNAAAVQNVSGAPNLLTTWNPTLPGGMAGSIQSQNILATGSTGRIVGAAWDETSLVGGKGRLSILMDADWF